MSAPTILHPIDLDDHAGRVLNSLLYQLRSLEQVAVPRLSMAALAPLVEEDVAYVGELLYRLTATANALHQLAANLWGAFDALDLFVSEGWDLETFARFKQQEAAQGRRRSRRLSTRPAPPTDLAPFHLHRVLAGYFVGSPGEGEKIGSSQPGDYALLTSLVVDETRFTRRDPGQPAIPANLSATPLAELPAGLATAEARDERFAEVDTSLRGRPLVAAFLALLAQGRQAAATYHALDPHDVAGYQQLHAQLSAIGI